MTDDHGLLQLSPERVIADPEGGIALYLYGRACDAQGRTRQVRIGVSSDGPIEVSWRDRKTGAHGPLRREQIASIVEFLADGASAPPPTPAPCTITGLRRGLHRCPTDGCGAAAAVLQMSDDTLTLVWAFPQAREIWGGPDETAMDTGVRLDDLDHGDFRCGYCAAPRVEAGR